MSRLEDLATGALQGVLLDRPVRVVQVEWHDSSALTLTYTDDGGRAGQELIYRNDEPRLVVEEAGWAWSLDADGHLFRLVSEAKRISPPISSTRSWPFRRRRFDALSHQLLDTAHRRQPLPVS